MDKLDLMLQILGINFNDTFEIIDAKNKSMGIYVIEQNNNGKFILKQYQMKTSHWREKPKTSLGMILINVIIGLCTIKKVNQQICDFKPIRIRFTDRYKDYIMYIEKTTANNDKMIVEYINYKHEHKVKELECHDFSVNNRKYCNIGVGAKKLYEGYSGPIILADVPTNMKAELIHIATKYGSIVE